MTMTVDLQKEISKEVISILQKYVDKSVIIAGGAPRNWDEDILARDVDIYFRTHVNDIRDLLKTLLEDREGSNNLVFEDVGNLLDEYGESLDLSIREIKTARYKGVSFQFIVVELKDPIKQSYRFAQTVLDSFSINLSKIYSYCFPITNVLVSVKTTEYLQDRGRNTITVEAGRTSGKQLMKTIKRYLPKIESYYPTYTVNFKE